VDPAVRLNGESGVVVPIRYCKTCVNPSTRPNTFFDENGICPACRFAQANRTGEIDWAERRRELAAICEWGRQHTKTHYDCIVTVSGGKDSLRQALFARDELGMNPLLVSSVYPPEQLVERGAYNLGNLISLGFDTVSLSLNPKVWTRLMKEGFYRFGNWARSTEMALYAIPIHIAIAYKIPLLFYGENPAWTIGEKHGKLDGDASRLKQGHTISGGPRQLMPDDMTMQDTHFYFYPSDDEMTYGNLRLVYLGYYIPDWSGVRNAEIAIAHGLRIRTEPPEMIGDINRIGSLDEDFRFVNQFMKYIKFGFGSVTDQVVSKINKGEMTREEGFDLVRRYDGRCDRSYILKFCHFIGITEAEFWQVVERFRGREAWEKGPDGEWRLRIEGENPFVST
jgi:N-acetyl sugar amidotransferase